MNYTQIGNQNPSLERLKFFAALMITNSHFGELYGKYSIFATGGAIGDALFFFCSGIALSLSHFDRFDNWYKRRFFRVYPSVIATNLLSVIVGLVISYDSVLQPFVGGGMVF